MKAIETSARFDENGELQIDNLPAIKNRSVKLLFLLEETDDDFHLLSAQGLAAAYGNDEPEYSLNEVKEPNPVYRNEGR